MMKYKTYRFTALDKEIIEKARKANKDKRAESRLKALALKCDGKSASEIAAATGFCKAYITQLIAKYRDGGIEAIAGNHYGGNRRNMSYEEESALLEPFTESAEKGQMIEVSEIKRAYEKAVGHKIGGNQIYLVLKRHGWRKIMPRSRHPQKADEEAIEASKKLTAESPN